MKITTNAHLLSSLTSLIDPNQRGQHQALQEQQDTRQKTVLEQSGQITRQNHIEANRDALKKLQERLKADNLEKLKAELSLENLDKHNQEAGVNLNLRESLGNAPKVQSTRPGQIIDIRV